MTQRPLESADLYRLRLISDPQISPDGGRIAFVLRQMDEDKNEYIGNIYMVDREGRCTQFTTGGKDNAPRWSPDGRWLAFLSGREERAQLFLMPTNGGEATKLTDLRYGAGVAKWAPDSTALVFTGQTPLDPDEETDEKDDKDKDKKPAKTRITERATFKFDGAGWIGDRRRHLFRVDVSTKEVTQLTSGDFHDDDAAWSPDSAHIAFSSHREERWDVTPGGDIYLMPRDGGEARLVIEGAFSDPVFSPDGARIAFSGYDDPEKIFQPTRLYSADRSGDDLRDEQDEWDGHLGNWVIGDVVTSDFGFGLTWRADGLFFIGTKRGKANVYRANGGTVERVTQGAHDVTDFSLADDGTMAFSRGDSTHLAEIYVQEGIQERRLTHENDGFLEEVLIREPERISYEGANGEYSEGWLLAPRNHESGTHPLLVYLHGGPQFAYGEALFFEYQFLAGQGFGIWFPNIHGSATYGAAYQNSIHGNWGVLDYQDVLAGTEVAASQPWVDANRVGIIGGSYGGFMTIWAMGHTDRFKAGITERCLANWLSFFGTSDAGWMWNRVTGAYPEDDVQKLWDMSPIKYVPNIKAPLMVMHSEHDDRTPIEQGEQVFVMLRRQGTPTKFIRFQDESHGLSRMGKPSRRIERLGYILEWFRTHL